MTSRRLAVPLGALFAGAVVSLLIGVVGSQHQPTFATGPSLGFGSMIQMKVVLALVVGVLAIGQVLGALRLYGRLGRRPAPRWLGTAHRVSGTFALLLSLPVAYHCLWALGFQAGSGVSARVAVHSILGCILYGTVVVKVVAVHARQAHGWFLSLAGGLLFTVLAGSILTSAVWFLGANGWPSGGGY